VGHFGGGSGRSTPITGLISGKPDRGSLGPILLQKSASGTWGATIESERASSWVKVAHQRLILNQCCSPGCPKSFCNNIGQLQAWLASLSLLVMLLKKPAGQRPSAPFGW
jgi:hypothetical protein